MMYEELTSAERTVGKMKFKAFDMGEHQIVHRVLEDYNIKVDAVIYAVNAYDAKIFAKSREELHALLPNEYLAKVPFLIVGVRVGIDPVPSVATEFELVDHLGLTNFTTGKGNVNLAESGFRPLEIFMVDITQELSHRKGFEWVSQYIK